MKNICCFCQGNLLRHLKRDRVYWFCLNCHQEMPNLCFVTPLSKYEAQQDKLSKPITLIQEQELHLK